MSNPIRGRNSNVVDITKVYFEYEDIPCFSDYKYRNTNRELAILRCKEKYGIKNITVEVVEDMFSDNKYFGHFVDAESMLKFIMRYI